MDTQLMFGYGSQAVGLSLDKLNRHGLIAGATGTGKTVTLKVIAEQLSLAGIPVFLSDIKGDLISLAEMGSSQAFIERLQATHYENYDNQAFPIELWDAHGQSGLPLRVTVSEMGPILLANLLGLNETQTSILNVVFSVADEKGLLLIDLTDLRAMLNFVGEHAKELSGSYGNISKASIGVILRSIVVLEQQGADAFFAEPSLEIEDLLRVDESGKGIINILNASKLYQTPTLYAMVLLALLGELFDSLPEVGDLAKPKMVFFFDEAHVLFDGTPKVLVEKIELMVRLIRSKGVGIFFVTQNPMDLPDSVSSQLGNRIQHGLRAFTPKELKVVKAVSQTFRQAESSAVDLEKVLQALATGEAVVSTLDSKGTPNVAERVMIYPPMSKLGLVDPQTILKTINHSQLLDKYSETINRESAHEQLNQAMQETQEEMIKSIDGKAEDLSTNQRIKELEAELAKQLKKSGKTASRRTDSNFDRFTKNMMSQVGREIGRVITRSISGMFKK
ncbi:helicase HerA-like domain-containing protein [Facklamia sp. P13064]|uniref:helicase HerA-like domain-containing protein n=1 Tax=unclassified Facklamia TaxID=2622293 RepID=UPI003D177C7F